MATRGPRGKNKTKLSKFALVFVHLRLEDERQKNKTTLTTKKNCSVITRCTRWEWIEIQQTSADSSQLNACFKCPLLSWRRSRRRAASEKKKVCFRAKRCGFLFFPFVAAARHPSPTLRIPFNRPKLCASTSSSSCGHCSQSVRDNGTSHCSARHFCGDSFVQLGDISISILDCDKNRIDYDNQVRHHRCALVCT